MPKKKNKLVSLRGMHDILPKDQVFFEKIRQLVKKTAQKFGFERIDTPILERAELFERTVGEATDIVEKEMYTFTTKSRERVVLRPEFTASIARAYIENGLDHQPKPIKLYSLGPLFRYERPQEGRYRQHHQIDFEAYGTNDAIMDAQIIFLAKYIINKLGVSNVAVLINSIGCSKCRRIYVKGLLKYFKANSRNICLDCRNRLKKNPLRVLDCKDEKCQPIIAKAPQLINSLCEECEAHFKKVLEYLEELGLTYEIDPSLVRGLDYYNRTVFEIATVNEEGKGKNSLGGGGRYDGLLRQLGGPDRPGVGFGLGVERIVNELKILGKTKPESKKNLVYLIQLGEMGKKKSLNLYRDLWQTGISVSESFGKGSLTAQLKTANRAKAELALIIGQKEALDETVIVRNMLIGSQEVVPRSKVIQAVKRELKNNR